MKITNINSIKSNGAHTDKKLFANEIFNGLKAKKKTISSKYFYDDVGSKLFQKFLLDIKKILFSKQSSDLEKEKMVRKYSLKLLIKTVKIFLSILIILLPFILFIILDYFIQFKFLSLLISLKGFLISFAIFIIYGNLRSYDFK